MFMHRDGQAAAACRRRRGSDNVGHPHTKKQWACVALVELHGERWYPGPQVTDNEGRRYRADLALPDRHLAVEVRSCAEARKVSVDRVLAFHKAGWHLEVVSGPEEMARLLRRGTVHG